MQLGWKIRDLRKRKNMTIQGLATVSGLSASVISQIERDMINPTVDTLWQISKGLDVHIGYFFNSEVTEPNPVVKKDHRKKIVLTGSNATYELLCPNLQGKIEFIKLTLEPGERANKSLIVHEGEECGVVIEGRLLVILGDQEYILDEGDSIYFSSLQPHRFVNVGEVTSVSYWAMTPPSF